MKKLAKINKNFDLFFCFLNNELYFKQTPVCIFKAHFKNTVLVKITNKSNLNLKLWCKRRNLYFLHTFYKLYASITSSLDFMSFSNGFFVKLDLIGLGFRVVKVSEKLFYFSLGWANGIYFLVPKALRVFVLSKNRQIVVFGFDINKVFNVISMLILLRKTRPYRITGFVNPLFIQRLRSGKQR